MGNSGKPKKLSTMQKDCSCDSVAIKRPTILKLLRVHSDIIMS